jgi:uncharacterized protein YbbC (DUF1343 family)
MKIMRTIILFLFILIQHLSYAQKDFYNRDILTGADQTDRYLHLLANKRIGLVVNQTSVIGNSHLVDTLYKLKQNITVIFAPEHGFRGDVDAGDHISNTVDPTTRIPIISLYGNKKGPDSTDLSNIDLMIFDIQDVGVRFYTYISTLQYVMESCARYNKPLLILDRPNPNGFYIDGPVLERKFESFVGMQPIPVVYALTIGEYATMLNGERWLNDSLRCNLQIMTCRNYTHKSLYELKINPSPNLTTMNAIFLYPTLCFFEGTMVSVGRGTDLPFQVFGYPGNPKGTYTYTPVITRGNRSPLYLNKPCVGYNLSNYNVGYYLNKRSLFLSYIIDTYQATLDKTKFFNSFFEKLAGTDKLRKAIEAGKTEAEIRLSWQDDLKKYKAIRKKYLLYPDFE